MMPPTHDCMFGTVLVLVEVNRESCEMGCRDVAEAQVLRQPSDLTCFTSCHACHAEPLAGS